MNERVGDLLVEERLRDQRIERPLLRAPLWLLALITFSATLAMHIFVPALPRAAIDLGASVGATQMTISVYIFGLALGQLVYGPVADRYGRRPVLMAGLALYTLAGFACILAPNIDTLIVARLFQALGGCCGMVLGRAIVRDTSAPNDAARRLALMNLMVTVGPAFAPLVGGLLATTLGWRSIFVALCMLGIANVLFVWRLLPETGTPALGGGAEVARNYKMLLRSPAFIGFSVGGGCATTAMYAFVASAPFIFVNQLHRSAWEVSVYIGILVSGVWLGSLLASRLIGKIAIRKLLVRSNLVSVAGAFVFLAAVLSGHLSVPIAVASMLVFTIGVGISSPTALTLAVSVNPHVIGSASGLYGFAQMGVGAICTALAGLGGNPALSAALVLAGAGIIGQCAFWMALRKRPRPV
jgi:DHA1 family bicyclomycin/chloramphenicol resistance-like MFS transporter